MAAVTSRANQSSPGPLYQNEVKCSAFDMEIIFNSQASKTHFHKKGYALGLILKVKEVAYSRKLFMSSSLFKPPLSPSP